MTNDDCIQQARSLAELATKHANDAQRYARWSIGFAILAIVAFVLSVVLQVSGY